MSNEKNKHQTPQGVLSGKRVLELGRVVAAPFAAQILGDLGAEVIKVERPGRGDDARHYAQVSLPGGPGKARTAATFLGVNRNKQSITVDFTQPAGQELIRKLATQSDVLIENFKSGTLARYGLSYDDLRQINPRLVYCSLTGYGQEGPYADRLGYDPIFQALSGLMDLSGIPEGQPGAGPQLSGVNLADFITGQYAAMAVMSALYARDTAIGTGQYIDISLLDAMMTLMSSATLQYQISGVPPARGPSTGIKTGPSGLLRCADADLYFIANRDNYFAAACQVLGCIELIDRPEYKTQAQRGERMQELLDHFNARAAQRTALELCDAFNAADVPASVVNDMRGCLDDPHVRHRRIMVPMPHPAKPDLAAVASPLRLATTPPGYFLPPPELGEHTDRVLRGLLGLEESEIEALRQSGTI
jgi:crotonobetainyl-CoA:carnitine CoA-transferase CaiB-like acyl-CoA transferase